MVVGFVGVLAGVLGGTRIKLSTDRNISGMWDAPASAVDSNTCVSFESDANESRTELRGDWRVELFRMALWINGVRGVSGPLGGDAGVGAGTTILLSTCERILRNKCAHQ